MMSATPTQLRMQQLSANHYIDGALSPGAGERRDVIDPATEQVIAHLAEATRGNRAAWGVGRAQRDGGPGELDRANALHRVVRDSRGWRRW
jgi:acyl-CoA reductase-like NAD-dependent aldehyde dehydrogenase